MDRPDKFCVRVHCLQQFVSGICRTQVRENQCVHIFTFQAVSYTHLDVYKRQALTYDIPEGWRTSNPGIVEMKSMVGEKPWSVLKVTD